MERLLIQGGHEYLPFARSRIRALYALGMRYVSQTYTVNGVTINVRLDNGNHVISIKDSGAMLMDSGVVDIGYVFVTPYADCKLMWSTASSYNAGFTAYKQKKDEVIPLESWLKNPEKTRSGQLSGDVSGGPSFRGHLPVNDALARSFSAKRMPEPADEDGVKSGNYVRLDDDDNLLTKKYAAMVCPASVFTGKCRLYVQAMYGRHIYNYEKNEFNPYPKATAPDASGTSPYISVKAYKPNSSSNDYADIVISTNSGVYLDAETGIHWLINFHGNGNGLIFYPLVGDHESMRWMLKKSPDGSAKKNPLSVVDFQHLEAYILASCLPDVSKKIEVSVAGLPGAFSLGYGWHWSWSTGEADIVTIGARVKNEGESNEYYCQASEHHRIKIAISNVTDDETGVVKTQASADLTVVQQLTEWNVYRFVWCILEPLWREGGFTKTTLPSKAVRAVIFDADAPIYAFYRKDVLHVARLKIKTSYPAPDKVSMYPPGFTHYYGHSKDGNTYSTLGTNGGFVERIGGGSNNVDGGRIVDVKFTCGPVTIENIPYNRSEYGYRTEVSEKTMTGGHDSGNLLYSLAVQTAPEPYTYTSGWPSSQGSPAETATYNTTTGYPGDGLLVGNYSYMNYNITKSDVQEHTAGTLIVVAPRGDAEALFVRADVAKTRKKSNNNVESWIGAGYASWYKLIPRVREDFTNPDGSPNWRWTFPYTPNVGYDYKYQWSVSGSRALTPSPTGSFVEDDEVSVESLHHSEQLISAGVYEVDFPDIWEAHNEAIDDISAYTFSALSGTSAETPTVFAHGRLASSLDVQVPAIVGWL